jgi:eukaryotic-like serine/threonine-protein kinase
MCHTAHILSREKCKKRKANCENPRSDGRFCVLRQKLASYYDQKAFELRERASEREKFRITNIYLFDAGELQKALESAQLWAREYPQDKLSHVDLGLTYSELGHYELALIEYQKALNLDPQDGSTYSLLIETYLQLNRVDEAKSIYRQSTTHSLDSSNLHHARYAIAFMENDATEMERQISWALGKPGTEDVFVFEAAATEAYFGRLRKGRQLTRRAIESALRSGKKEDAARYQVSLAWREADCGNPKEALAGVVAALADKSNRDLQVSAGVTLARAGDSARAQAVANDLQARYPLDRLKVNGYWLPTIHAAIEMDRDNASRALEFLRATSTFELYQNGGLYAAYLRGLAYLLQRRGAEAATEFQKLLDHQGLVGNSGYGALARLGLARAYVAQGDTTKARSAYQDFLTLWKDADPDIPILKQAKAEYAKLR